MINPGHLLRHVIRPVLKDLNLWSEPAERMVLGTACQESECGRFLVQVGGPALGIYQMEPKTEYDLIKNFIRHRPALHDKMKGYPRYLEVLETIRLEELSKSVQGEKIK